MAKNGRKTSKALVVVTDETETKPDTKLVDDTVGWIREKIAETVFKGGLAIGAYVLEKFFDGDMAQVRSTNPKKGASFRSLAARCADDPTIRMSKSALHRAVSIAAVVQQLPEDAAYLRLASSHQGALLPVHDAKEIEKLAQRVLDKKLSVAVVAELVKEKREPGETRGRPKKSVVLKALRRSLGAFTIDGGKKSFSAAQIHALDADDAKKALADAEGLVDRLNKLIEKLKGQANS
jgi:hypothetical protein